MIMTNHSIAYEGPDNSSNTLSPNSVVYWLNGSLTATGLLDDDPTAGGSVHTSTNNLGTFSFNSNSTGAGADYVIDDLVITELLDFEVPDENSFPFTEDFETETPGSTITDADTNSHQDTSSNHIWVVSGAANTAGTGNGVDIMDSDASAGVTLDYDFVSSAADMISARAG